MAGTGRRSRQLPDVVAGGSHVPRDTLVETEKAVIELNVGVQTGQLVGMPYSYWRDWASRDGVAMVKRFAHPTLVLHGTRDYQVSDDDFAVWQRGLRDQSYVELVTVGGVNHLFIAGRGAPTPLEYKVDNHVDPPRDRQARRVRDPLMELRTKGSRRFVV